jgi:hypothetical protein
VQRELISPPNASAPCASFRRSACSATYSSASSQVVSTNLPSRRINGCVRRSAWLLAWKPKKPRAQRSPLFRPAPCAEFTSISSLSLVCTVIRQPSPQKVQIVSARLSIQGRYSYMESRLVMAPTGQIWMQPPQNSQSSSCGPKCLISVMVPRPTGASAFTSMISSQYRTQRKHCTQRFICVSMRGLKYSFWKMRLVSVNRLVVGVY